MIPYHPARRTSVSTQEIDFTAGTDSHPNDPHVETPGRVRPVAVPPAARTLGTLPHIDYEDAFLVETGPCVDWSCGTSSSGPAAGFVKGSETDER